MRLISVHIQGYKRFAEPTTLWVRCPLVAIVGPNEAGKTSLLDAMHHLSRAAPLGRSEYTDRREPAAVSAVITARYAVDRGDRQAAGDLLDDQTDYILTLFEGPGDRTAKWQLKPPLFRDLTSRGETIEELRRVVREELLVETAPPEAEDAEGVVDTELNDRATRVADRLEGQKRTCRRAP